MLCNLHSSDRWHTALLNLKNHTTLIGHRELFLTDVKTNYSFSLYLKQHCTGSHLPVLVAAHHRILHSNGHHLPIYSLAFCLQNQHSNAHHLPIHSWPSFHLIWDKNFLPIYCEQSFLLLLDNNMNHGFYHKSSHF